MSDKNKLSLTTQILIAMTIGIVLGLLINVFVKDVAFVKQFITGGLFLVVGKIFVAALKMLVVPLVFVSLVVGVTSMGDIKALGRIGIKALSLYLLTTAVAITIALSWAITIAPGSSGQLDATDVSFTAKEAPPLSQVLIDMVPSNPIAAMADANMLQVIVFTILFAVAITMAGDRGKHVLNFFNDLNEVIMQMVNIIMKLAPIGVFCLVASTFAEQGIAIGGDLLIYFVTLVSALLLHATLTYGALLRFIARLNPLVFFNKMRATLLFAFSTASSNATIPVTLRTCHERLGVDKSVASFTVPFGATINMDGTAIMQGVATVFIANIYGIDLGVMEFLTVILTATLASIGAAGVPGIGLITLTLVLQQVGLPVEGIGLIIGIDRLLDMIRTAVNVSGDSAVSCIIAQSEQKFDKTTFDDATAGTLETINTGTKQST